MPYPWSKYAKLENVISSRSADGHYFLHRFILFNVCNVAHSFLTVVSWS